MAVYRRKDRGNHWCYRRMVRLPDGTKQRIQGKAPINTKAAAEKAERAHVERLLTPPPSTPTPTVVPTFTEWFEGRFWDEVVIAEQHAPNTKRIRRSLFESHLRDTIGGMALDQIDVGVIQRLKAELAQKPGRATDSTMQPSTQRAILSVVGTVLNYAEEAGAIKQAPRVKTPRVQQPEIETWGFDEHVALLGAAEHIGFPWLLFALLAGDAGLRASEVRGLQWHDIDFSGNVLTVRRQRDKDGVVRETTKGKKIRTVPLSSTLQAALGAASGHGEAWVVGVCPKRIDNGYRAVCKRAGLPVAGWHCLRHTFGSNCARFKAGPWELQRWLGHGSVTMTERYVHLADAHRRELPGRVATAIANGPIAAVGALSAPALPSEVISIRRGPHVAPEQSRAP